MLGFAHGALRHAAAAPAGERGGGGRLAGSSTRARPRTPARPRCARSRRLQRTVSRLGRILRSQEEFIADASHELRTPLTALQLRLESLERNVAEPGVGRPRRRALRGRPAVGDGRGLARTRACRCGAVRPDRRRRRRRRTRRDWHALAQERGVALVADTDGAATARAAPERLTQIIDNFVANALEVSPEGSTVTTSRQGRRRARRGARSRRGTRSQRRRACAARSIASGARGSGGGGSGLGLAIVRKLADADAATGRARGGARRRARRRPAPAARLTVLTRTFPICAPIPGRALSRSLAAAA